MENEKMREIDEKLKECGFVAQEAQDSKGCYYIKDIKKAKKKISLFIPYDKNKKEYCDKVSNLAMFDDEKKKISFSFDREGFKDLFEALEAFYYAFFAGQEIKQVSQKFFIPDRDLTEKEKQKIREICKSQNILNYEDISKYTNALKDFEDIYNNQQALEQNWQNFFQKHLWVLGLSLQQQLLIPSRDGKDIKNELSKRNILDGSLISEGKVNYLTICEFKRCKDKLVEPYRNRDGEVVEGCFAPTSELSGGIAQILQYKRNIQKEAKEQKIKDKAGNDTGKVFQIVDPKCYLIIGDLKELEKNDGKKQCFELFRRNCKDVEIITYDEIYEKIKYIVDNMKNNKVEQKESREENNEINDIYDDDIPF